jgi:replicative DNA helicase
MLTRHSSGSEPGRRDDPMGSVADSLVNALRAGEPSLATGFAGIDRVTGGLKPGDLVLVAGYPGVGKTTLATSLATNIAVKQMKPVALFSPQTAAGALCDRFLSALAPVDSWRLRSGLLSRQDRARLAQAISRFSRSPICVSDKNLSGVDDLASLVQRAASQPALIILDGMQSLIATGADQPGEAEQLEFLSRGLKLAAREMRVPILATCQVPIDQADPDQWRPGPPCLSQLGTLDEHSDVIILLHREDHQLWRIGRLESPGLVGRGELIVAKNRSGPTGRFDLTFDSNSLRFQDWSAPRHPSPTHSVCGT